MKRLMEQKRKRGRPPKAKGEMRVKVPAFLPPGLVKNLKAYVDELRKDRPGASRGDVLVDALQKYRPFRKWLARRRP